jgi:hypothetical protein
MVEKGWVDRGAFDEMSLEFLCKCPEVQLDVLQAIQAFGSGLQKIKNKSSWLTKRVKCAADKLQGDKGTSAATTQGPNTGAVNSRQRSPAAKHSRTDTRPMARRSGAPAPVPDTRQARGVARATAQSQANLPDVRADHGGDIHRRSLPNTGDGTVRRDDDRRGKSRDPQTGGRAPVSVPQHDPHPGGGESQAEYARDALAFLGEQFGVGGTKTPRPVRKVVRLVGEKRPREEQAAAESGRRVQAKPVRKVQQPANAGWHPAFQHLGPAAQVGSYPVGTRDKVMFVNTACCSHVVWGWGWRSTSRSDFW